MVDRLVTAGLIDRRPHPTSRRELVVELTPRGQEIVRAVTTHRREEIARIVHNMPERERTVSYLPSPHSPPLAVKPQPGSKSRVTWSDTTPFSDPARQVVAARSRWLLRRIHSGRLSQEANRTKGSRHHRPTLLTSQRRISL